MAANLQLVTSPQPADTITVLRAVGKKLATKTWELDGTISSYGKALNFTQEEIPLDGLDDLGKVLNRISEDPKALVIRGKLRDDWREILAKKLPEWNQERLAQGKQPINLTGDQLVRRLDLFTDQPHNWAMIDVDGFQMEPGEGCESAINRYIQTLPHAFWNASCHWQLSGSAGHAKSEGLLKVHLWFWFSDQYTGAQLRPWAESLKRQGVNIDASLFNAVQIHYTAPPVFAPGVVVPAFKRSGTIYGFMGDVILEISPSDYRPETERKSKHDLKDPREKSGIIGAFHRVFDLECALAEFIPGEFDWIDSNRLTWNGSDSGAPGGVYVAGGYRLHLGANHGSWPWGADHVAPLWDIIRHFKFGKLDDETGDDLTDIVNQDPTRSASQEAMYAWAKELPEVTSELERESQQRRRDQQAENMRIGDGTAIVPHAESITLDEALSRFIYVGDGKGVFDQKNPAHFLDLSNFKQFYAASVEIQERAEVNAKGKPVTKKVKVSVPGLWASHPDRVSVIARSFKAGDNLFITDPEGRSAVNTWRDFDRSKVEIDPSHVAVFVGHVTFIFGEEAKRFIDWLAHIEQNPGELPHTAWLSIATHTGLGRNWISSVLSRVWAGRVAANFDILGMFEKGFNGRLAGKILACVDEIKAGGNEAWPHSEKLKSIVTEETREVNPKYGRQFVEHNAVRWLIFSNHLGAIPLDDTDRRWEVVINEKPPRDSDYYVGIYGLMKDHTFIDSVAGYLAARDISKFNPGAHAEANESKQHVLNISKSDLDMSVEDLVRNWPSDIILSTDVTRYLFNGDSKDRRINQLKSAMPRVGARSYREQVKVEGRVERAWILRKVPEWVKASRSQIRDEGLRGRTLREFEDD